MEQTFDKPADGGCPRIFKANAHTTPSALASALTKVLAEHDYIELEADGAGAIYRATMGLTIARIRMAEQGIKSELCSEI